ncbi:MAG TPA: DNA polymerase III subunit gamma/tau [Capillimicrobium sp.]|nr:DNA polymerase III subunit gamma/tau [Capillimicrobium sp.]
MSAPSLYRRHRPRSFADVVGQEHVVRTLSNAVQQGKVHHANLFVGSRGTGKTSMAKILASCLNCVNGPTVSPCGVCDSCVSIANATSMDVIEMDAASNNSVDDIRDLRERVAFAPVSGRHKVYILDEAHMLSSQAWNAFLKTLEEPPPNTIFVLATTEANKVLPTVVDRCHRFDFKRPTADQVASVIRRVAASESIDIGPEAVALIARHATGSFRDALGTLEQLVTYSGSSIALEDVLAVLGVADRDLLFDALDAVGGGDARAALLAADRLAQSGRDAATFVRDLEGHARELLVVRTLGGEVPAELALSPEHDARLAEQAARVPMASVVRLLDLLAAAMEAVRNGADARTQLELALVKAATPEVDASTKALLARIDRLEAMVASGALAPPAPARAADAPVPAPDVPAPPPPEQPSPPPPPPDVPAPPPPEAPAPPPRPAERSEPEPEPEPAASPVAVAASPSVETLVELWPAILDTVRAENGLLAAILSSARPVGIDGPTATFAFPQSEAFGHRKAEDAANRQIVAQALRAVTGHELHPTFELRDELPIEDVPPPPTEDEWIARFKEAFDAEELTPDEELS